MLIHIAGSTRHFEDDEPYMQVMAEAIQASGDTIIYNWLDTARSRHLRQSEEKLPADLQEMIHENEEAVVQADALIIEGSRFSFSQGYLVSFALQHHKPVLNLYRKDLTEYKEWPDKFFVVGVSNPLFINQAYTSKTDLDQIIAKFLSNIRPTTKELDVKLALNQDIYQQLDRLADESGKSKASIIKDIISKNISI